MDRQNVRYGQYIQILNEELKPAMGCTEPIAIAYAAAKARAVLGTMPERLLVEVSGNIIKNVKSWWCPTPAACGASRPPRRPAPWPGTPTPNWRSFPA